MRRKLDADVASCVTHVGPIGVARSQLRDGAGVAGSACKRSRAHLDRSAPSGVLRVVRDALERRPLAAVRATPASAGCPDLATRRCAATRWSRHAFAFARVWDAGTFFVTKCVWGSCRVPGPRKRGTVTGLCGREQSRRRLPTRLRRRINSGCSGSLDRLGRASRSMQPRDRS